MVGFQQWNRQSPTMFDSFMNELITTLIFSVSNKAVVIDQAGTKALK